MMSQFWWGHRDNGKKIAWMSWGKMGCSKDVGGLGYRDLECFNLALLAKQGWRLFQNPDSLVAKIFKEKYFRDSTFWRLLWAETRRMHGGAYGMQSLFSGKGWFGGLVNGHSIHIWGDKWLPKKVTHEIQSPIRFLMRMPR
jgi:hypothetical protein